MGKGNNQTVVSLVCPTCGGDLSGLKTDSLFGCDSCSVAYEPKVAGLAGPYPIRQSTHSQAGDAVTLPFWQLYLDPLLLPEQVIAPGQAYVPGFDMRRRSYFGDPALRWTVDRARLEQAPMGKAPMGNSLLGMTLSHDDALELARYYVLRAIDNQQDVTGFDLDIRFSEPTVLQVDFADEGANLVDPVLKEKYPAPAFCDLPLLRGTTSLQP